MESRKLNRYLVLDNYTGAQVGVYSAEINDEAIRLCLQDPAVQPLLHSLARMALQRRVQEQKFPARGDDLQAAREIRRLKEEFEANPLRLLVGVLEAQDVNGLIRMYRPHIQVVIARRMAEGDDETRRDEAAGTDVFESSDLVFGSYRFWARCVRHDGDRQQDAELSIDLVPPGCDHAEQGDGPGTKGNGKANQSA